MAKSPLLRSIIFWTSFYTMYTYSSRDPHSHRQLYPSYAIFKEKIIKDTWRDGFNCEKIATDFGHYKIAL